nr:PREDICTED: uncharacterized protein LOC103978060 [Musa acuminata subsp. malaccensis]
MASVPGFLAFFCGSLGFPSLSIACNMFVLPSLLFLGLRVWCLGFRFQELDMFLRLIPKVPMNWKKELCTNGGVCAACGTKIGTRKPSQPERSKRNKVCLLELGSRNWTIRNGFKDLSDEEGENDGLQGDGTVKLKEKIAEERKHRTAAVSEPEKERVAASSAADEAMAKIAKLQNEKGLIEREARLYREMAEQKQSYDDMVIETLHWIIMKLEAGRSADIMRTTV